MALSRGHRSRLLRFLGQSCRRTLFRSGVRRRTSPPGRAMFRFFDPSLTKLELRLRSSPGRRGRTVELSHGRPARSKRPSAWPARRESGWRRSRARRRRSPFGESRPRAWSWPTRRVVRLADKAVAMARSHPQLAPGSFGHGHQRYVLVRADPHRSPQVAIHPTGQRKRDPYQCTPKVVFGRAQPLNPGHITGSHWMPLDTNRMVVVYHCLRKQ